MLSVEIDKLILKFIWKYKGLRRGNTALKRTKLRDNNYLTTRLTSSVTQSCPTLRPHLLQHARLPCPSPTPRAYSNSCSIKSVMPSNHLILCHPLLLLPSIFPSIRVFSNRSVLRIRWPKYWSFSFSISPFNEYSGLISFRIDWFDLTVQGTLKSLLQHHSSKASVLKSYCNQDCVVLL